MSLEVEQVLTNIYRKGFENGRNVDTAFRDLAVRLAEILLTYQPDPRQRIVAQQEAIRLAHDILKAAGEKP